MRLMLASVLALTLLVLPSAAQPVSQKSKAPQHRIYADSIDMSTSQASLRGFVDAYAASDFFKVYLLLSPEAKSAFLDKIYTFSEARLFPGMAAGTGPNGPLPEGQRIDTDVLKDIYLDGAVMFDRTMLAARSTGLLPFDFAAGATFSPTFERENEARYTVQAKGRPDILVVSTIRLSNGNWRIERIVWPASDPEATPWGFK